LNDVIHHKNPPSQLDRAAGMLKKPTRQVQSALMHWYGERGLSNQGSTKKQCREAFLRGADYP
jgi:hypothetical protein